MIPQKPANVTWTDEQWQAIYEENKNIIVSAGAGSGKTAVLTERVIRKLKDGIKIDELLILTFTKAAAEEMKDRIRKKIKDNSSLIDNLNLLDSSYITTFDSFALSIVKKYHYLLNISPNINVIDSNIIQLQKEKLLDEIFLSYYENRNAKFLKMIDTYCIKDDKDIRNSILSISNHLDLLSNKEEYLNHYIENHFKEEKINKDIETYLNIIKDKIEIIKEKVKEISYLDSEFSIKLNESLEILYHWNNYEELISRLNIKLPIAPRGSEEDLKTMKKEISEAIKEIKELTHYSSEKEIKESILSTKDTIEIILEIIKELTNQINLYKEKVNSYEFQDIAIMAIKIVSTYQEAREELKNKFQEIMIDEYQDTNDLQEEFISYISKNNTYMVGDIKQSIYRFRNANPYIFKNKYDTYAISKQDTKIDLNKNFRSRKEVLENINQIFIAIMNDEIGGSDYLKSHQMIFGNNVYLKEETNHSNNMEIQTYSYDKELGYTKEEIEAFIIAKDIQTKINDNYQVLDKKTNQLRNIEYKDFAIIMDRATNFDLYKKIFNYFSIPVALLKNEQMNEDNDILVISNLIQLIIKIKEGKLDTELKYLLVSISRSFLKEYSDREIWENFKNKSWKENYIYKECLEISKKIDYITPYELLNIIIETFNYYENHIKIGNIKEGIIKITKIKELAKNLESLGYNVYDFSNYLKEILENGYKLEYLTNENSTSSVKIMTIHKSKGLEFPICYFSGLYKEFNISDLKQRFLYDKNIGIIVPYYQEGISSTIYKDILKKNYIEEEISEKIRLFYVALTRAKEKIILISPITEKENLNSSNQVLDTSIKINYRSFSNILDSIYDRIKKYNKEINIVDLKLTKEYNIIKKTNYKEQIPITDKNLIVNEISPELEISNEKRTFSKHTESLLDKETINKMNYGTMFHEYLEYIDLKHPDYSLIEDNYIKDKIKAFLNQKQFKNIKEATIYQEYEFIEETPKEELHGIIDLMLEYENHIEIIDYKLKNIEDKEYIKQLKGYQEYIKTKTNKPIKIYLYSIIDEFLKEL